MTIDGQQRMGGGEAIDVVQPHKHAMCWESPTMRPTPMRRRR